jgi:peptidoglycan hydrolase-like protein with peptidoglycan-binding domain
MATYTTLRIGSKGNDVKKLQQALGITADGIYGSQTAAAVKAYQKKNGLSVDGIAGNQTLGTLYGSSSSSSSTKKTTKPPEIPKSASTIAAEKSRNEIASSKPSDFAYADYEKSDIVKQAEAMLQQQLANKPGEYQSNWQAHLDETMNKILNREKFTYDINGDALYQQYKDQYINKGQLAMQDTMGQAAAMTGGYGNSYAESVGQQAYQGHLQQLNDKIPELYKLALDQYNQEEQKLYNQYGLYAEREEQDYGRYRDSVSDYYNELNYLTEDARYQAETDYNKYKDDKTFEYGVHRDVVTDWQNSLDRADNEYWNLYGIDIDNSNTAKSNATDLALSMLSVGAMPSADLLASAGISSTDASAIIKKVESSGSGSGSSSGGSDGSSGSSGYDNSGYKADIVKKAQKYIGASQDGKWGSDSTAKAKAKGYNSLAEVVAAMGGGDTSDASEYADWDASDWNEYFASIRQTDGKAAAEKELNEFASKGLIPQKYLASAGVGARGSLGH